MFRILSLSIMLTIVLIRCSGTPSKQLAVQPNEFGKDAVLIDRLFGETENHLSFPVWFDSTVISQAGITRIDRSIFLIDLDDTLDNGQPVQSLRERRQYWFFSNGKVKKIRVTHYYDDQDVGHMTFGYYDTLDNFGFSAAYKMDATGFLPDADLPADFPFRLDRYISRTDRVCTYRDEVTKSHLHMFDSPTYWGVISIDSIANPKPEDWLVLGTMSNPIKLFHLTNKVVFKNVINWQRNRSGKTIRTTTDNYPFYVHRTYTYSKNGSYGHFIDSTFSDEGFLSRTLHQVKRNSSGWIEKVVRKKENQGHRSTAIRVEFFDYETSEASANDPNKMRNFTKNQKK